MTTHNTTWFHVRRPKSEISPQVRIVMESIVEENVHGPIPSPTVLWTIPLDRHDIFAFSRISLELRAAEFWTPGYFFLYEINHPRLPYPWVNAIDRTSRGGRHRP